jgi:hypothetical protein
MLYRTIPIISSELAEGRAMKSDGARSSSRWQRRVLRLRFPLCARINPTGARHSAISGPPPTGGGSVACGMSAGSVSLWFLHGKKRADRKVPFLKWIGMLRIEACKIRD